MFTYKDPLNSTYIKQWSSTCQGSNNPCNYKFDFAFADKYVNIQYCHGDGNR